MCGAGAAPRIKELAERYPHPEVWTMAIAYMERTPATRSRLGQLEATVRSCAEQLHLVASIATVETATPRLRLADRVFLERHARKLRDVPIARGSAVEWAAWEQAELAAAMQAIADLKGAEERLDPDWRARYAEASLRYELAREAVERSDP